MAKSTSVPEEKKMIGNQTMGNLCIKTVRSWLCLSLLIGQRSN